MMGWLIALNLCITTALLARIFLGVSLIIGCDRKDITHSLYPHFLRD
jgi:hypothetical protein